jgi:hypothetical protein
LHYFPKELRWRDTRPVEQAQEIGKVDAAWVGADGMSGDGMFGPMGPLKEILCRKIAHLCN